MSQLQDFAKCVKEAKEDGRTSIECKLGLWWVSAIGSDSVYLKAFQYWKQYANDGEYRAIIGGPSVMDKMTQPITTED